MKMIIYETPCVEIIEVQVEQGFAQSGNTEPLNWDGIDKAW